MIEHQAAKHQQQLTRKDRRRAQRCTKMAGRMATNMPTPRMCTTRAILASSSSANNGARLRMGVRSYDSIGRFGGEEFIALLPDCDGVQAAAVAGRILQQFHAGPVVVAGTANVTVSVGVCARRIERGSAPDKLIAAADRALYAAKSAGRDRVMICGEIDETALSPRR
jgi:hypothetical protein